MRIKKQKHEILEGDLTPMIDMTFQLIAFFMVLINFTQSETNDMVQLPDSALAKPPDAQLENLVIIHLGQDGTAVMNQTEVSYLGLRHYLDVEYYRIDVQTTDNPQDTTIVIRAHRAAKGGMVQELIQICQEAGFENFALRAEENINSAPKYITPLGG